MNNKKVQYLQIVRGFGLYHAVVSLPLAIPILSARLLNLFGNLHERGSIPGTWMNADATPLLFVNLFAALAVCWGIYRFRHASKIVGRYEGWAMLAFTFIVIYYVWQGASALWLVIAGVDGVGAMMHLLGRAA